MKLGLYAVAFGFALLASSVAEEPGIKFDLQASRPLLVDTELAPKSPSDRETIELQSSAFAEKFAQLEMATLTIFPGDKSGKAVYPTRGFVVYRKGSAS